MAIINTFPTTITNGQLEDATVVMSLFAWIQSQTNGNGCPATTGTAVLKGDGAGATTAAVAGTDYLSPSYLAGTPLPIAQGGTGSATSSAALTALGAAPIASPTFTGTVNAAAITAAHITTSDGSSAQFGGSAGVGVYVDSSNVAIRTPGGSGTGVIYFQPNGGGISYGRIEASGITANAFVGPLTGNASTASALSTASGAAPSFGARAWCVFDGTVAGTNAPIAGGNVTSVNRNGVGDYTVNFTVAMPDANYAAFISCQTVALSVTNNLNGVTAQTASARRIFVSLAGVLSDSNLVTMCVFR